MSNRDSSMGPRSALEKFLFQDRIAGTDTEIAITHETNRQSSVKEILVHIFLMSKFKIIQGALTVAKAENQYLGGTGNDAAAHCAPGQILSSGMPIQRLITNSNQLEINLENLFANTDELHLKFNLADSRAEENGLRAALGNACNQVAQAGRFARFERASQFYGYISAGYSLYKAQGLQAFRNAINIQRTKLQGGIPLKGATRQEIISILEMYSETLASSFNSLDTVQRLDPEEIWRDYDRLAKSLP